MVHICTGIFISFVYFIFFCIHYDVGQNVCFHRRDVQVRSCLRFVVLFVSFFHLRGARCTFCYPVEGCVLFRLTDVLAE